MSLTALDLARRARCALFAIPDCIIPSVNIRRVSRTAYCSLHSSNTAADSLRPDPMLVPREATLLVQGLQFPVLATCQSLSASIPGHVVLSGSCRLAKPRHNPELSSVCVRALGTSLLAHAGLARGDGLLCLQAASLLPVVAYAD